MPGRFPYAGLPDHQIWKRAVSETAPSARDPQHRPAFTIDRSTRIASAGSCFALKIAESLRGAGYTYLITEPGSGYSARYGDIYTTLQLAQLARRCIGEYAPLEPPWPAQGRYLDPFRPRIHPGGYATVKELETDRAAHLQAVKRLLTESDVFIFTLGLTEVWCSKDDGAALPICPGAGVGTFDSERYVFRNLTVEETIRAFDDFLAVARALNPMLRIILTVSPVPLAATMEPRHVVQSTVYSKSVLRVAAEALRAKDPLIEYFASYEMVAGGFSGVDNYEADRREVNEAAVRRVMRSFFHAFAGEVPAEGAANDLPTIDFVPGQAGDPVFVAAKDPCDEAYMAQFIKAL